MPQGSFGSIKAFNDFYGAMGYITWASGEYDLGGGWGVISVNEGTIASVTDEEGGIIQFTNDTADNDNVALIAGPFKASNGGITLEARFKLADITESAVFVGFSETMTLATPVMPAEFATATMTYNGSGGLVGLVWDPDATTNAWKAVCGDGGAVSNSSVWGANGTNATDAAVNDEFDIVRVTLSADGVAQVWHDDELVASGATGLTATDLSYAVLVHENRTGTAGEIIEIDYVYAEGQRDWSVD